MSITIIFDHNSSKLLAGIQIHKKSRKIFEKFKFKLVKFLVGWIFPEAGYP